MSVQSIDNLHFRALNLNFDTVDIIENYSSIIWTEKYNELGDFEIHGPLSDEMLMLATPGIYILNSMSSELMIVETVTYNSDLENGDTLTISGASIGSILDRRVLWNTSTILRPVSSAEAPYRISKMICDQVAAALVTSSVAERRWTPLSVLDESGVSPALAVNEAMQFTMGENLLSVVTELAQAYGLGFRTEFNPTTKKVKFIVYMGVDRTLNNTNKVIFSERYDNLSTSMDTLDFKGIKNVALTVGRAEDETTKIPLNPTIVSATTPTGLDRREIFYVSDQEKVVYNNDTTSRAMTTAEYQNALRVLGLNELSKSEYQIVRDFDGSLIETSNHIYGETFNLGDVVFVETPYETPVAMRLSSVTYSDDQQEKKLLPSFIFEPEL